MIVSESIRRYAAIEQRSSYSLDHRVLLKDGSLKVVYEHAEISFDAEGNPIRMLGTVQDVTEQRRVQSGLERFRAALDSSADSIFSSIAMRCDLSISIRRHSIRSATHTMNCCSSVRMT
ncbi:PAS domain-containing protein [Candidatus Reidiella endopervernicosa]